MDLSSAKWRKSSYTGDNQGNCVELANAPGTVAVRDSKDPNGPAILLGRIEFRQVTSTIKNV